MKREIIEHHLMFIEDHTNFVSSPIKYIESLATLVKYVLAQTQPHLSFDLDKKITTEDDYPRFV